MAKNITIGVNGGQRCPPEITNSKNDIQSYLIIRYSMKNITVFFLFLLVTFYMAVTVRIYYLVRDVDVGGR
jgi:hypothetical protein